MVAATPQSLTASANPIANADVIAGAMIGATTRMAPKRPAPCTCGRVLELLVRGRASAAVIAR